MYKLLFFFIFSLISRAASFEADTKTNWVDTGESKPGRIKLSFSRVSPDVFRSVISKMPANTSLYFGDACAEDPQFTRISRGDLYERIRMTGISPYPKSVSITTFKQQRNKALTFIDNFADFVTVGGSAVGGLAATKTLSLTSWQAGLLFGGGYVLKMVGDVGKKRAEEANNFNIDSLGMHIDDYPITNLLPNSDNRCGPQFNFLGTFDKKRETFNLIK